MQKLKTLLQFNKVLIIVGLLIFFYVLFFTKVIFYKSQYNINTSNIEGKILLFNINGNKLNLEIKAKEKIKAVYYIQSREEKNYLENNLCLGCTIIMQGTLEKPKNNTIPNTFNYKNYLYNKKIYYIFNISDYQIKKNNSLLSKVKDYFYHRVNKIPNSDYLKIFILGDKSLISSEDYNSFQKNGVSHLLAISGMHIGVFLKILDNILAKLKYKKKLFITVIILLFYAYLTNFAASILRAVFFYIFLNIKKICNLKLSNFQVLIITAYFLIIINPFIIYDIGFIYSFVITGGIILNNKYIKGNYFKQLLILSIISFLFSLPITINLNYEINLTSILANLIYVPYISLIVYPLALLVFLLPFLSNILAFLLLILSKINSFFNLISIFIIIPKMPIFMIIIYYIILLFAFKHHKLFYLLCFLLVIVKLLPKITNSYEIYYLDVGQGDSSVIISPWQKEVIMIDTGGKINYSKEPWQISTKSYNLSDNVIKFLKSKGIRKIDYLFLSHGDMDHAGEALNIIQNLKVENVYLNNGPLNDIEKLIASKSKVTTKINLKYFAIQNLNNNIYEEENDNSLVLYFKIANYSFLYMGDASKKVEEDILKNYDIPAFFLKVGHHGSNTSSSKDFIDKIKNKYAIISVGKNNSYGHPNIETLKNLSNSKVYRTDDDGSVAIKINKNNYFLKTYKP